MAFLFEPYNAYQKPPKKKHWMEIAEEEALLHRVQLEEQARQQILFQEALKQHLALREANAKANQTNLNNQNVALPQYAPQPASQQVQDGQYAAPAGGGGWVLPSELEKQEVARFSAVPSTGVGPLTVTFTNLTISPDNDTFLWNLGSGSFSSSAAITPPPLTYTQSGSYTVTLQSTSSEGNKTVTTQTITVTDPTLFAWISTPLLRTSTGPYSASFDINKTGTAPDATVSGYFHYGDGTVLAWNSPQTVTHVYDTGSYTASLALTESSYGHTSVAMVYVSASAPALRPSFSVSLPIAMAPYTASFYYLGSAQVGNTTYGYRYVFGDGDTSTSTNPDHVYMTGSFIVYMTMTESYYKTTAVYILPGGITGSLPRLVPGFTATPTQSVAPFTSSLTNSSSVQVSNYATINYRYVFGDGTTGTSPTTTHIYPTGSFVVELQVTESWWHQSASFILPGGITGSVPTLIVAFVTQSVGFGGAAESYMEPVTNSYTASIQYDGVGFFTYFWDFGTSSLTSTSAGPIGNIYYTSVGPFTASLQLTESSYNIARISSQSFYVDS